MPAGIFISSLSAWIATSRLLTPSRGVWAGKSSRWARRAYLWAAWVSHCPSWSAFHATTCAIRSALARPCGTRNTPPRAWARLWVMPSEALVKAMPAMQEALCIFSRASRS
ncbi:hypothetical protein D3C85_1643450 [compost metagenome]